MTSISIFASWNKGFTLFRKIFFACFFPPWGLTKISSLLGRSNSTINSTGEEFILTINYTLYLKFLSSLFIYNLWHFEPKLRIAPEQEISVGLPWELTINGCNNLPFKNCWIFVIHLLPRAVLPQSKWTHLFIHLWFLFFTIICKKNEQ